MWTVTSQQYLRQSPGPRCCACCPISGRKQGWTARKKGQTSVLPTWVLGTMVGNGNRTSQFSRWLTAYVAMGIKLERMPSLCFTALGRERELQIIWGECRATWEKTTCKKWRHTKNKTPRAMQQPDKNKGNKKLETLKTTCWFIPLSKWVITLVICGLTPLIPFITRVITHLLSGMNHQVGNTSDMFLGDPVDRNFFPGTRYRRPEMKTVGHCSCERNFHRGNKQISGYCRISSR